MSSPIIMPKKSKLTREDLKWATTTEHHLAKANDQSGYLFCVELKTENKELAVNRAEMLIELLANWGYMIRKAGEQQNLVRPGVFKGPRR